MNYWYINISYMFTHIIYNHKFQKHMLNGSSQTQKVSYKHTHTHILLYTHTFYAKMYPIIQMEWILLNVNYTSIRIKIKDTFWMPNQTTKRYLLNTYQMTTIVLGSYDKIMIMSICREWWNEGKKQLMPNCSLASRLYNNSGLIYFSVFPWPPT